MWVWTLSLQTLMSENTNEGELFIFKMLFWDVQAPCNRCLFIFIINKSKDSLLFNIWFAPKNDSVFCVFCNSFFLFFPKFGQIL